jgi:uncharacterized protein YbjQ (UPF0145 family)
MPYLDTTQREFVHIVTTPFVPGHRVTAVKGLVWANSVKARSILKDIVAMVRVILGGEVWEYTQLLNEARHEIMLKLNENAKRLKANGIINVKISTAQIVPGTVEILAYGTAVELEPE